VTQAHRTQLREDTTAALFILDALDPVADEALHAAADDLVAHLARLGPGVRTVRRLKAAARHPVTEPDTLIYPSECSKPRTRRPWCCFNRRNP